jgi:hypothetical protein
MNNPKQSESTVAQSSETVQKLPSPWRCLSGALIAGGIASPLYFLTTSISQAFASKPIHSDNPTVVSIGVAVRTLVLGVSTLATALFALVAIGLVALAIQVLFQGRGEG